MIYQNLVKDFALRTRANLEVVRDIHKEEPGSVYEVTQLVNSMLGLLVFPQQRYIKSIPALPLSDLKEQGWPIPRVVGSYPQVTDLKQLLRYLRNAIAHFNVVFWADNKEQIAGLRLWNTDPRTRERTWEARLTIEDLEGITDKFIELLLRDSAEHSGL